MTSTFDLPAWLATTAGIGYWLSVRGAGLVSSPSASPFKLFFRNVTGAITRHGKYISQAFFPDTLYSRKKKGVRYGPVLEEGG